MERPKIWGRDELLLSKNCVEVHVLHVSPDPETGNPVCSSYHCHDVKWNQMYVIYGSITIKIGIPTGGHSIHLLKAGETIIIPPKTNHRFEVRESAKIIETVWAENIHEDIHRHDQGHVLEE